VDNKINNNWVMKKVIENYKYNDTEYTVSSDMYYSTNYNRDLHLCIIDNNHKKTLEKIKKEISKEFNVINEIEVKWSKEKFKENSTRLFNKKLILRNFTILIFEDLNPKYFLRIKKTKFENLNVYRFYEKLKNKNYYFFTKEISEFFRVSVLIFGRNKLFSILKMERMFLQKIL